jgi:DNA-directed RNA polymerase subunit RPC12/RpoP
MATRERAIPTPTHCDRCGADFDGGPIPEDIRHHYGSSRWSRVIAVYDDRLDCTVAYECPDCGHETPRPMSEINAVRDWSGD